MTKAKIDVVRVGSSVHTVSRGESIASISSKFGLPEDTVWLHASNATLREKRPDPDLLLEGDKVFIPEVTIRQETGATEQRHRFRRKGIPRKLRVRLHDCIDEPLRGEKVQIDVDGLVARATTDAEGWLEHPIDPQARKASVYLTNGDVFEFQLGHLSPPRTTIGLQQRLLNLGFYEGPIDGASSDELTMAIVAFQESEGLPLNGIPDAQTIDALIELCSC